MVNATIAMRLGIDMHAPSHYTIKMLIYRFRQEGLFNPPAKGRPRREEMHFLSLVSKAFVELGVEMHEGEALVPSEKVFAYIDKNQPKSTP